MAARVLPYRIGILALLREIAYTLAQMRHEPLAGPFVAAFQAVRDEWQQILLEEIAILSELADAQAAANKADAALDAFAGRVSRLIDEHTTGATRKQLRAALFKNKALSKFRRAVLAGQLAAMTDWSTTIEKCGVPALAALAPEAATLVEAGKQAEALLAQARQKNRDFRDVGARKQFIDKTNAARKESHGGLAKLPFQNPALPPDFADGFYYITEQAPRDEEETIDEVKTSIEELEAQLVERKAQLKKLEEEAAAEALAEQQRLESSQAADELEAKARELLQQAAALRGKPDK